MAKKVIARPNSFDDYDAEEEQVSPKGRPHMPMDEADQVRDTGIVSFPTERHPSRQELLQQIADLQEGASALALQGEAIVTHGFQFTPTGLIAPEQITQEAWEKVGLLLFRLEGSIQWLLGDWLVYGEDRQYGDVVQIADFLGKDKHTLYNYMSVSRAVESSRRRELVPYSHHQDVMALTPEQQNTALAEAEKHRMNRKEFREWLRIFKGSKPLLRANQPPVEDYEWSAIRSDTERLSSNPGIIQSLSDDERKAMIQRFKKLLKLLEIGNA